MFSRKNHGIETELRFNFHIDSIVPKGFKYVPIYSKAMLDFNKNELFERTPTPGLDTLHIKRKRATIVFGHQIVSQTVVVNFRDPIWILGRFSVSNRMSFPNLPSLIWIAILCFKRKNYKIVINIWRVLYFIYFVTTVMYSVDDIIFILQLPFKDILSDKER